MIKRVSALVFAAALLFSFVVTASADYDDSPVFNVPTGFTTYEYIQSDGNGWIETDVRPTQDTGVWFDAQMIDVSASAYMFGSDAGDTANDQRYDFKFSTLSSGSIIIEKQGYTSKTVAVEDDTARMYYGLDYQNNYVVGGSTGTLSGYGGDFTSIYPCYIFAYNYAGTVASNSTYRLYRFQFFDGETLIRDLYPASNESGTYGLLDAVDGGFYPVSTVGTFTVGDVTSIGGPSVADEINELNEQIAEYEDAIYNDLHTYSEQVDPSSISIPTSFVSAINFISTTWVSAYDQLGDFQVVITFPLFLAIALLFIGRASTVIVSGAMKSRKNNDKQGGGNIG